MPEITINDVTFPIRPLKRHEVKALKKNGFTLGAINGDQVDNAMDAVFDLVLTPEQINAIDQFDNPDALRIWNAILRATWGNDAETKNS